MKTFGTYMRLKPTFHSFERFAQSSGRSGIRAADEAFATCTEYMARHNGYFGLPKQSLRELLRAEAGSGYAGECIEGSLRIAAAQADIAESLHKHLSALIVSLPHHVPIPEPVP